MKVQVNYTPRGKIGAPIAEPLNFIGETKRAAIKPGYYVVCDLAIVTTYRYQN